MRQPYLLLIGLLLSLCSCQATRTSSDVPAGHVEHMVLMWLKDPNDAAARDRIYKAADELRQIPGVERLTLGRCLPSNRAIVDSTFSIGMVVTFKDRTSADAYVVHPIHTRAVSQVLQPAVSKILVYDVIVE